MRTELRPTRFLSGPRHCVLVTGGAEFFLIGSRPSMADELQKILLRVVEKEGPCVHGGKRGHARAETEGFEPLFVSFVAFGGDFEGQGVQCRQSWLVAIESFLCKDVPLVVD